MGIPRLCKVIQPQNRKPPLKPVHGNSKTFYSCGSSMTKPQALHDARFSGMAEKGVQKVKTLHTKFRVDHLLLNLRNSPQDADTPQAQLLMGRWERARYSNCFQWTKVIRDWKVGTIGGVVEGKHIPMSFMYLFNDKTVFTLSFMFVDSLVIAHFKKFESKYIPHPIIAYYVLCQNIVSGYKW